VTDKIRSGRQSLNNGTTRMGWIDGQMGWIGNFFGICFLKGVVQRRGVHVNTLKIGSRDGGKCFGGI
jgi:hypothetical protein